MAIRVTCNKCHTRFNVSDKFAGQTGPCPKCKTPIKIPDKSEEVVIQAPKSDGPTDSQGRAIVDPIRRKETAISAVQLTIIGACVVGFLAIAFVCQSMVKKEEFPMWLLAVAAFALAPPLVYGAYTFLRDQELDFFVGQELWARVLICSAIYALTWLAFPLAYFAFDDSYELGSYVIAGIAMLGVGGVTGMLSLDLDYFMGSVHYGLYMGVGLLGRYLAGLGTLPTNIIDKTIPVPGTTQISELVVPSFHVQQLWDMICFIS